MTDKYVSIVISSYNRAGRLNTAVQSARENAGAPVEIIVVDDGSTDPSVRNAINGMIDRGEISTVIFRNPMGHNTGRGRALNAGIAIASGDIIGICDQDVYLNPGWAYNTRSIIEEYQFIGWLALYETFMPNCNANETKTGFLDADYGKLNVHEYVMGSTGFAYRERWEEFGPLTEFAPSFGEDHERMLQLSAGDYLCVAPVSPLASNNAYGIGPDRSVLVRADGSIQPIETKAKVFNV